MRELYEKVARNTSIFTTHTYSTSFSLGIRTLAPSLREPICAIYGFVRFADEIVDTFHDMPQEELLNKFRTDTFEAIETGFSMNPILYSFQKAVNQFNIDPSHIDIFLKSMEMDLSKQNYRQEELDSYILGSAEVVGLMCLHVFLDGKRDKYEELKPYAMRLGAAFQKVNFLRDLRNDVKELGRTYFPGFDNDNFDHNTKKLIEQDIREDFEVARKGILMLPRTSRLGVYLAYSYYLCLFKKIRSTTASTVMQKRIRVPNSRKMAILFFTYLRHKFNLIHP